MVSVGGQIVRLFLASVVVLSACASDDGLSVAVPGSDGQSSAAVSASTSTAPQPITVAVVLPDDVPTLGAVSGRALDVDGYRVASFTFAAGWDLPESYFDENEPEATRTGAPTSLDLSLPGPGIYRFELDDYGVSGGPCGTCGQGYSGGTVIQQVNDGSVVQLTKGEGTWMS